MNRFMGHLALNGWPHFIFGEALGKVFSHSLGPKRTYAPLPSGRSERGIRWYTPEGRPQIARLLVRGTPEGRPPSRRLYLLFDGRLAQSTSTSYDTLSIPMVEAKDMK